MARLLLKEKGAEAVAAKLEQQAPGGSSGFRHLQPFHSTRRRALLHRDQFIPGCRVAIRVASRGGKLGDDGGAAGGPALPPSTSAVVQGILVAINDHHRCDVLCDNGSYEVDVAYSDLQPAAAATSGSLGTASTGRRSASSRDRDR